MRPEDEYRLRSTETQQKFSYVESEPYRNEGGERNRSGCLTIWLVLSLIVSIVGFFVLLPYADRISRGASPTVTIVLFSMIIAQAVAVYYTLQWKRWAAQLLVVLMFGSFIFSLLTNMLEISDFVSLGVGLWIMYKFVFSHWDDYE